MTLAELLVTLAVVLILISAAVRMGQYVKTRSSIQLTQSALAVIDTAMEQYYADFGAFPFDSWETYSINDLKSDIGATGINAVELTEKDGNNNNQSFASSAGLFWFLHRVPNSRSIVEAVTLSLISAKHPQETGQHLTATIDGVPYDLPRFVDPWGMSLRYIYQDGYAFPRVISAGPDKIFDTPDDIENK